MTHVTFLHVFFVVNTPGSLWCGCSIKEHVRLRQNQKLKYISDILTTRRVGSDLSNGGTGILRRMTLGGAMSSHEMLHLLYSLKGRWKGVEEFMTRLAARSFPILDLTYVLARDHKNQRVTQVSYIW